VAKVAKQDFLSQEPLKRAAREVTLYLSPRVGGKPTVLEVDRFSGRVGLRQGSFGFHSKAVKPTKMKKAGAAKKSSWTSEFMTIQRLAGRVR
jgi:hypothetical protein